MQGWVPHPCLVDYGFLFAATGLLLVNNVQLLIFVHKLVSELWQHWDVALLWGLQLWPLVLGELGSCSWL